MSISKRDAEVLYREAYGLIEQERYGDAMPILQECIRLSPPLKIGIPARQELARVLQEMGDLDGALRLRYEVKSLMPDRDANLWKLAQLLMIKGQYDAALMEAKDALRLAPQKPRYRELVAQLESLGPRSSSATPSWSGLAPSEKREAQNRELYHAAAVGDLATAASLAGAGADPNADWQGRTLLTTAAATGNVPMCRILLKLGANVKMPAQDGVTPLMLAAMVGQVEIVRMFLDAGADVHATRDTGTTALFEAVVCKQTQAAKLLLEAGANVDVRGPGNITVLQMATHNNMTDLVQLILTRKR